MPAAAFFDMALSLFSEADAALAPAKAGDDAAMDGTLSVVDADGALDANGTYWTAVSHDHC